jgi:GR25 family glycosyltransferase involved in LPS biosynthesis
MTIDELYESGNTIIKFTDYETEYLSQRKEVNSNVNIDDLLLGYLGGFSTPTSIEVKKLKVTANIATQPSRWSFLLKMLESIDGQFDEIRIYLNNFKYVPSELRKYTTHIGDDLTDNGKFFWSNNDDEYYFTLDDDIIYPPDYVEKTLPLIKDRIVTYHGRNLFGLNQPYYNNHKVYSFYRALSKEIKLDVGGTGVMAFNTNNFKPNLWKTPNTKMTDLLISLEASLYNIDIVCLSRSIEWLKPIEYYNDGIYTEFMSNDSKQMTFADLILTHKSENSKLDRKYLSLKFNRSSCELISNQISQFIGDQNKYFYHFGSSDGTNTIHFSRLLEFEILNGVETTDERVVASYMNLNRNLDRYKVNFFNQSYDKVILTENSVILMNDYVLLDEHSFDVWKRIPNGCHFITTKILDSTPVSKFIVVTQNEIEIQYFYYIKQTSNLISTECSYDKSLIITLDDCIESEGRFKLMYDRLYHFNNPEKFIGAKGRSGDYMRYVTEEWDKSLFNKKTSRYIKMSDGEIGCCVSHAKIWQKVVDENISKCLVLEDDAIKILPGFDGILSSLIDKLPEDWDILLLGFMLFKDSCQVIDDDISKVSDFLLTHCYLINNKGAKKLLDNLPINAPIDTFLSSISDKVNIYRHNLVRRKSSKKQKSYLIGQYSNISLINHTNVD